MNVLFHKAISPIHEELHNYFGLKNSVIPDGFNLSGFIFYETRGYMMRTYISGREPIDTMIKSFIILSLKTK